MQKVTYSSSAFVVKISFLAILRLILPENAYMGGGLNTDYHNKLKHQFIILDGFSSQNTKNKIL